MRRVSYALLRDDLPWDVAAGRRRGAELARGRATGQHSLLLGQFGGDSCQPLRLLGITFAEQQLIKPLQLKAHAFDSLLQVYFGGDRHVFEAAPEDFEVLLELFNSLAEFAGCLASGGAARDCLLG